MGKTYLLDTNIVIYTINGTIKTTESVHLIEAAKKPAILSVISKIELLGWKAPNQKEETDLKTFVNNSLVIGLSENIVNRTIELRRSLKIKLPDAIIAATALENNSILLTRNDSDFSKIPNLTCIDPFIVEF